MDNEIIGKLDKELSKEILLQTTYERFQRLCKQEYSTLDLFIIHNCAIIFLASYGNKAKKELQEYLQNEDILDRAEEFGILINHKIIKSNLSFLECMKLSEVDVIRTNREKFNIDFVFNVEVKGKIRFAMRIREKQMRDIMKYIADKIYYYYMINSYSSKSENCNI